MLLKRILMYNLLVIIKQIRFYILLVSDPELIGSVMTETHPDSSDVVTGINSIEISVQG